MRHINQPDSIKKPPSWTNIFRHFPPIRIFLLTFAKKMKEGQKRPVIV